MVRSSFVFLDGNPPWLDFVNTRVVDRGVLVDRLRHDADLLDWLRRARMLDENDIGGGRNALRRAREFREVLRTAAERLDLGLSFPPAAIRAVNDRLAAGRRRLVAGRGKVELRFERDPAAEADLLEPLARSVAEFVATADLERVRKCQNPKCVLFFYDATKNRARRWCRMAVCGNRMKAAAHYWRRRDAAR